MIRTWERWSRQKSFQVALLDFRQHLLRLAAGKTVLRGLPDGPQLRLRIRARWFLARRSERLTHQCRDVLPPRTGQLSNLVQCVFFKKDLKALTHTMSNTVSLDGSQTIENTAELGGEFTKDLGLTSDWKTTTEVQRSGCKGTSGTDT